MMKQPNWHGEPTAAELAFALIPVVAMLFGAGSFVWLLWAWLT